MSFLLFPGWKILHYTLLSEPYLTYNDIRVQQQVVSCIEMLGGDPDAEASGGGAVAGE